MYNKACVVLNLLESIDFSDVNEECSNKKFENKGRTWIMSEADSPTTDDGERGHLLRGLVL